DDISISYCACPAEASQCISGCPTVGGPQPGGKDRRDLKERKRRIRGPPLSREVGFVSLPFRQLGGLDRSATIRAACPAITRVARYALRRRLLSPGPNSQGGGILPMSSVLVKVFCRLAHRELAFERNRTNVASFFVAQVPAASMNAPSTPKGD